MTPAPGSIRRQTEQAFASVAGFATRTDLPTFRAPTRAVRFTAAEFRTTDLVPPPADSGPGPFCACSNPDCPTPEGTYTHG